MHAGRMRAKPQGAGPSLTMANSVPLMPFDPRTMIQSLDTRGTGLRITFFKSACALDRYCHEISVVENVGTAEERVRSTMTSAEGDGGDGWPASPPLQSFLIEERPSCAVALLVGMAGQNHWSASIE